jgi:hypothetical protein
MVWKITQLQMDYEQKRALVTLTQQGIPQNLNGFLSATVNFPEPEDSHQQQSMTEDYLKARAKQILLDAANSL